MGFIMRSDGKKPIIYSYNKSSHIYQASTNPPYYTWKTKSLWDAADSCLVYKNDSDTYMKITNIAIKTCSCNSGGQQYWSSTGLVSPCSGYGGTYYSMVRVTSETDLSSISSSTEFQQSSSVSQFVPNCSYNMNSKGSSTTNTACFGNYPYDGNEGLKYRNFEISDCPAIPPRGHAFIHIGISSWNSGSTNYNTTIRFILDPTVAQIEIEPETTGYIWRYNKGQKKWELVHPYYIYTSEGWKNVEELDK